jgi:hypothetical protein
MRNGVRFTAISLAALLTILLLLGIIRRSGQSHFAAPRQEHAPVASRAVSQPTGGSSERLATPYAYASAASAHASSGSESEASTGGSSSEWLATASAGVRNLQQAGQIAVAASSSNQTLLSAPTLSPAPAVLLTPSGELNVTAGVGIERVDSRLARFLAHRLPSDAKLRSPVSHRARDFSFSSLPSGIESGLSFEFFAWELGLPAADSGGASFRVRFEGPSISACNVYDYYNGTCEWFC